MFPAITGKRSYQIARLDQIGMACGDRTRGDSKVIQTNWVSAAGADIDAVEKEMAAYLSCKYAVGRSCGPASLHLAAKLRKKPLPSIVSVWCAWTQQPRSMKLVGFWTLSRACA